MPAEQDGRRRVPPEVRHRIMASIRGRDTRPERLLRSALWKLGARGWRCHVSALPGRPDLVFPRRRLAVFVDGAWWHGHPDYLPNGRRGEYWDRKIAANMRRDQRVNAELQAMGWRVVRFWDIDVLRDPVGVAYEILALLRDTSDSGPRPA